MDSRSVLSALGHRLAAARWGYIEIRPLNPGYPDAARWHTSATYQFHRLDLRPDLATLFRNFHHSSTQRKIRRAERDGLAYREGSNESLLDDFYRLLVVTRKRHNIPPQPRRWFRTLMDAFGDDLKIRLARKGDQAVAGMLTIRHKDTLYYKNGGSDARFHNLGGMHLLFWNSIQDAKSQGLVTLDFGRVDIDQPGLITFKNRWGATSTPLHYYRYSPGKVPVHTFDPASKFQRRAINRFCSLSPSFLLPACGSFLYKHIG
ncbi:MAG: lipid II:glycine glycyltransferase FemX [Candidatus Acidiferrales bacterium]